MLSYLNSSFGLYLSYFLIFLCIIYKWSTWSFNLDRKFGLTGPKPLPLFGNIFEYVKYGFHVCDMKFKKQYGDIYPVYIGRKGMLVVSDVVVLKQMLLKDTKSFIDRPSFQGLSKLMKKNLGQLQGSDWERVRGLISPAFTSGKLKKMSTMVILSVKELIGRFENAGNSAIDIRELFGSLTMDAIARTMFGIEINVSHDNSHAFIKHVKKLFTINISNSSFVIMNIFPKLLALVEYLYPDGFISPESEIYLKASLSKAIECRKNSKEEYHDFLAIMLDAQDKAPKDQQNTNSKTDSHASLTDEEIIAQSVTFLFAGYETTAAVLTFCAYLLSQSPETQDEVYNEIISNLTVDKEITYDILVNLTLTDQCLNETLRIYPPASRFLRQCSKDATLTTSTGQVLHVKKGTEFVVPVYAIHHDEKVWPNPEKFDIHRFDHHANQTRSAFSFIPFGMGARNCVGMRFALMEAKFALAHLLKDFKILPCKQTLNQLSFNIFGLLSMDCPVLIRLEKR